MKYNAAICVVLSLPTTYIFAERIKYNDKYKTRNFNSNVNLRLRMLILMLEQTTDWKSTLQPRRKYIDLYILSIFVHNHYYVISIN